MGMFLSRMAILARRILQDLAKGFKLAFHFVENPFFTNAVLEKEGIRNG